MRRNIERVEDDSGMATTYHRHPNGGGLLGPGARADMDTYIDATTYVEAGASVGSGCRIGRGGWIDRQAVVGDEVFIGDDVYVGRGTILGNRVHIGSHSRIGAGARIGHGAWLHGDTILPDGTRIAGARRSRSALTRTQDAQGPDSRMAA